MTTFEPGDVLLVPFPFTDFSTLKRRPCVVLSSAAFNRSCPDVIVAAITSRLDGTPADDELILSERDVRLARLPKPSKVRAGKIVTLDQRLVRSRLGRLPAASVRRVRALVRRII